ncbi:MAG: flagellar hook-length control protein FliK [Sedimentisphaerales bacterium]|nr:flagellar hook-length control protein FliK [Sedimentisphaerales bacterium]
MIENITNIGQILIPANQAVPGKTDVPGTRRFSIGEDQDLPERKAYEISSNDNKSQNVNYSNERNEVRENESIVDKKSNNEPYLKVESRKAQKHHTNEYDKTENSCDNEIQENEQLNPQSEVANDSTQNELPEQDEIANEDVLSVLAQSNTVTDYAVKPEQIKALDETESEQPGIETILPENSNGQNGLNQVPVEGQQTEKAVTENNNTQDVTELLANNNVEQISTETFTDKNNQPAVKDVFNMVQEQKNAVSETISEGKSKIEELLGDSKPVEQISQIAKKHIQNLQEFNKNANEKQLDGETNVSQAAQESDDLFDGSADNANEFLKQKPDIADALSSASIGNDVQVLDDNGMVIEQTFANAQTNETQNISTVTSEKAASDILKASSDNDVSTQISKHITESISSSAVPQAGEKQITVRLNPPELGSVMIKFSEKNSELTGTLQVSKAETKAEIENALPDIIKSLSESGIQLKRIDVVSTENKFSTNDSTKEQLMQGDNSGNSGQNESYNQNTGAGDFNKSRFQKWFSNTIEYSRGYAAQNQFASGSINMLA